MPKACCNFYLFPVRFALYFDHTFVYIYIAAAVRQVKRESQNKIHRTREHPPAPPLTSDTRAPQASSASEAVSLVTEYLPPLSEQSGTATRRPGVTVALKSLYSGLAACWQSAVLSIVQRFVSACLVDMASALFPEDSFAASRSVVFRVV